MHTFVCRVASITFSLLLAVGTTRAGDVYVQTNLVTNNQSLVTAQQTDPNLQGAWGLSFSTTSPFWISDQAQDRRDGLPCECYAAPESSTAA